MSIGKESIVLEYSLGGLSFLSNFYLHSIEGSGGGVGLFIVNNHCHLVSGFFLNRSRFLYVRDIA